MFETNILEIIARRLIWGRGEPDKFLKFSTIAKSEFV